jgi:hypothetical protein
VVNIILLFAIVSACACLVFFTASGMVADGPNWASEVCSTAPSLCRSPQHLAYFAVGLTGLWLLMRFVSATRG